MAATEKQNIWFYSRVAGQEPAVTRKRLLAASQGIYMAGAPFYLSTSGTLKLSDTSDGTGDTWHWFAKAGVAAEQAANTAIRVAQIERDILYCVYVENNTADAAIAQANVGNEYGLTVSSTAGQIGYTTLDLNNSNDTVTVFDALANLEAGRVALADSPGIAVVRFLNAVIEAERS